MSNKPKIPIRHIPLKRIFDILFSLLVLAIISPFILLIILSIKLSSPGKAIYSHKRMGRGGKLFNCYKFRSMYSDADERLHSLLAKNAEARAEWEANYKLKSDPRVTPIGKFLRKYSLDEFPQFWNVLLGDMSVVGPRPMIEKEVEDKVGEKAPTILSIRPGLTGLWQVSGRSDTCYERRIELDQQYIHKRNLILDLKIVLMTIPCLISSRGAY